MNKLQTVVLPGTVLLVSCVAQAQTPPGAAMALMKSVVNPQSDIVFAAGKKAPSSDREWAAIGQSARKLTEAAKSLEILKPAANPASWTKFSRVMAEAAAKAGVAAKQKNVDALLDAGDLLYESCQGCHQQHLKK